MLSKHFDGICTISGNNLGIQMRLEDISWYIFCTLGKTLSCLSPPESWIYRCPGHWCIEFYSPMHRSCESIMDKSCDENVMFQACVCCINERIVSTVWCLHSCLQWRNTISLTVAMHVHKRLCNENILDFLLENYTKMGNCIKLYQTIWSIDCLSVYNNKNYHHTGTVFVLILRLVGKKELALFVKIKNKMVQEWLCSK